MISELASHFVNQVGDKILIEIKIQNDPDEVIGRLMKSIRHGEELAPGITVEQVYFKGRSIEDVVSTIKTKIVEQVTRTLTEEIKP
jgi:Cu/Ag efflux pump CusA